MGIKPLYLRHDRSTGAVLFASELRAMLASGLVDSSLSLGAMCSYLETGSVEDPLTMIEGVSALLPGHYALWREGRLETHEYWDIPLSADGVKRDAGDLEAALAGAAKRHLASDVPVSVFLSGGVDSGALLSLLGEEAQATHAFTVGFDVARYDESPLAHEVARAFGVGHTTIRLSQEDVRSSLDAAVQAYDQPSVDGVNTFVIARAVREGWLQGGSQRPGSGRGLRRLSRRSPGSPLGESGALVGVGSRRCPARPGPGFETQGWVPRRSPQGRRVAGGHGPWRVASSVLHDPCAVHSAAGHRFADP